MLLFIAFILIGVALLWYASEILIEGASALALRIGMSPLSVGITIVAFGTSLPEAFSCLTAHLSFAKPDLALANILGSNIANIALVLGVCGLIKNLPVRAKIKKIDTPMLFSYTLILAYLLLSHSINWVGGCVLLIAYAIISFVSIKTESPQVDMDQSNLPKPIKSLFLLVLGLVLLPLGAHLLLKGSIGVAQVFNLSDRFIGITLVALGTSAPEVFVSASAVFKGKTDIAFGNIIGSNLFNTAIIGIAAALKPLAISNTLIKNDLPILLGVTLSMLLLTTFRKKLGRLEAIGFILFYIVYLSFLKATDIA